MSIHSVSVIIPALNEAGSITAAVTSGLESGAVEVLVVDGGSHDATRDLAMAAGAHVVDSPRGRDTQQNRGAGESVGDVLLFLHADCRLASTACEQIRTCLEDPHILSGAFRQQIEGGEWLYRALERGNAARVRWRGMAYGDQALFFRRGVFNELGGFPNVPLMEDLLLMRAARHRARPALLRGPVYVSSRRWQRRGVVRQTLRNWSLIAAHALGVPPEKLATFYPKHDE
jgi:rSAM/selenodomain-associated transferase 2